MSKRLHVPRFRLREQLLVGLFLLVILPVLVVGIWINYRLSQNSRQEVSVEEAHIAKEISLLIDQALISRERNLSAAAMVAGWDNPQLRQRNMDMLMRSPVGWDAVEFQDTFGRKTVSVNTRGVMEKAAPWSGTDLTTGVPNLTGTVAHPVVTITKIDEPGISGEAWLLFAVQVVDAHKRPLGRLMAYWPMQDLRQSLSQNLDQSGGTHVWLADSEGQFVLEPQNVAFLQNAAGVEDSYNTAFVTALRQNNLIYESSIPRLGWHLVVAQNKGTALNDDGKLPQQIAGITGVILLLALVVALIYIRSILRPIGQVMEHIRALSDGVAVEDLSPLKTRRNELGEVAAAVEKLAAQTQDTLRDTVLALVAALEARDPYTRNHSERVALFTRLLASRLNLSPARSENVFRAALLHDVGKIGIPEHILNKAGPLNGEELAMMHTHPRQSYNIVKEVPWYAETGIADMILQHHERWDGQGYPDGLSRENVLFEARILAIADAFDAMTSDRVYRKALSLERALTEVEKGAGYQFDPELAQAFLTIPNEDLQRCLGLSFKEYLSIN